MRRRPLSGCRTFRRECSASASCCPRKSAPPAIDHRHGVSAADSVKQRESAHFQTRVDHEQIAVCLQDKKSSEQRRKASHAPQKKANVVQIGMWCSASETGCRSSIECTVTLSPTTCNVRFACQQCAVLLRQSKRTVTSGRRKCASAATAARFTASVWHRALLKQAEK